MLRPTVHAALLLSLGLALSGDSARATSPLPPQPEGVPFPTEAWPEAPLPAEADGPAAERAVEALFAPQGPIGPDTRAVLVVRGGRIVLERYAADFGPSSRFRSFSAAKSLLQALVARLVAQDRLALDAPAPVAEWRRPNDPRRRITLRHLLQMTAGLDNADGPSEPGSFVADILYGEHAYDSALASLRRPLLHEPGTHWAYSTGTSQILSQIVAREAGGRAGGGDRVRPRGHWHARSVSRAWCSSSMPRARPWAAATPG